MMMRSRAMGHIISQSARQTWPINYTFEIMRLLPVINDERRD